MTVFFLHRVLQCLTTAEYGVFPAASVAVIKDLGLSDVELGLIGTLTYAGISVSSLISGVLFRNFGSFRVCVGCMMLSVCGTLATMLAPTKEMLLAARFTAGFAHGPLYVYFPVWVDSFAPEGKQTTWMGWTGFIGAIANIGSYAFTAYLVYGVGMSWRWSFTHLAIGVAAMLLGTPLVPEECWTHEQDGGGNLQAYKAVFRNPTFWCLSLVISTLWYTVSSIEYFGLLYINETFDTNPALGAKLYVIAGTGLGLGVGFGSFVSDRLGGYGNRKGSFQFTAVMASLSLPITHWLYTPPSPTWCMVCVSYAMFCFASMMPVLLGLVITTVPGYKTEASGMSNVISTVLGFMLGPALVGWIGDTYGIQAAWYGIWLPAPLLTPFFVLLGYVFDGSFEAPDLGLPELERGEEQEPLVAAPASAEERESAGAAAREATPPPPGLFQ